MADKKVSVFLIDDDQFLLEMYAVKFKSSGFEVEIASDSESALVKLRSGYLPDIVLLDVVMPKMSGFELLELLRKENLVANAKIIILSNLGQKEDIEKGKSLGVDDYVVKASFTPTEVVEKIKTLIK